MNKPLIFISHITEEKELADLLRNLFENAFNNNINIFQSSSADSIDFGDNFIENINTNLNESCIGLVLCSNKSVSRPWLNFESGFFKAKNIKIFPFCHSGMLFEQLPYPVKIIQGQTTNNIECLKNIIEFIERKFSFNANRIDYNQFIQQVQKFEEKYTFWNSINTNIELLLDIMLKFGYKTLEDGQVIKLHDKEEYKPELLKILYIQDIIDTFHIDCAKTESIYNINNFLESNKILSISPKGNSVGTVYALIYKVEKLEKFNTTMENEKFIYFKELQQLLIKN